MTTPKQNERTKQYWDSFYSDLTADAQSIKRSTSSTPTSDGSPEIGDDGKSLEWIVASSFTLLDHILRTFPSTANATITDASRLEVLEIGCGLSQLSRLLLDRLIQTRSTTEHMTNISYSFVSTDVSSVCLERNRRRDLAFVSSLCDSSVSRRLSDSKICNDSLRYEKLDVLCRNTSVQQYDIILDKGTLDTFLFRSKRSNKGSELYPPLLLPLLENLHRWLRHGCKSKYIIISPRAKIKAVRDYNGFESVRRCRMNGDALGGMVLLESNRVKNDKIEGVDERNPASKSDIYIYECIRNDAYQPDRDEPFRSQGIAAVDDSVCPRCSLSFKDLRGSVEICDQGEIGWSRRWNNHLIHCKSSRDM